MENEWLKQPHLAETDGTLGLGEMHTCCILSNQCALVKPAISTHTQGALLYGTMEHQLIHHSQ